MAIKIQKKQMNSKSELKLYVKEISKLNSDEFLKSVENRLAPKFKAIQGEIYASYRSIVENTVTEVFLRTYGESFSLQSLRDSIIYTSIKDFRPDFSYDISKLKFYSNFQQKYRTFNFESKQDYVTRRPLHSDVITTGMSIWDLYDLNESLEYESEDEEWDDLMDYYDDINSGAYSDSQPVNKLLNPFGNRTIEDTYQLAKTEALRKFNFEFETHIKPNIIKKYRMDK